MAMIALRVPDDVAEKLNAVEVAGKSVKEDMHITMFYFEQKLTIASIIKIMEAMYAVANKTTALKIKGTKVSSFPKGDDGVPVIVPIESEDLLSLRNSMAKKLTKFGIKYSNRYPEYKPHLTLSYSSKEVEDKKLTKPVAWSAHEVVLWAGDDMDDGIVISVPFKIGKKASNFSGHAFYAEWFQKLSSA